MRRYVLTGTPGAEQRPPSCAAWPPACHTVVEEAATELIARAQASGEAEPWTRPSFIDEVITLQRRRQQLATTDAAIQIYNRIPDLHPRPRHLPGPPRVARFVHRTGSDHVHSHLPAPGPLHPQPRLLQTGPPPAASPSRNPHHLRTPPRRHLPPHLRPRPHRHPRRRTLPAESTRSKRVISRAGL
ncbi:hypothetical protein ACU686_35660 [Yinghuangia aomiensis]